MTGISRRHVLTGLSTIAAFIPALGGRRPAVAAETKYDLSKPLEGWETIAGTWMTQRVPAASRNEMGLVQAATDNEYNVIVAPGGPYKDVLVSVRFRPISGREDASGGIVFRFAEGRYYLVRANALEDNFRLYYFDRGRRMLSTTSVTPPALGQWHQLQIAVKGDRIQGWLNQRALLDERDSRFTEGRIGLWTKADSITAFDDLTVTPMDS